VIVFWGNLLEPTSCESTTCKQGKNGTYKKEKKEKNPNNKKKKKKKKPQ
jgi:hypothetical protein